MPSFLRRFRGPAVSLAAAGALAAAPACAPALTTQQEVQAGAQYAAQLNRELPLVRDAALNRYINNLGTQISRRADPRGIRYTFYVVNSDAVNAFAVPGGHVYVNRGLIERADNMMELGGVLGHEIAHVVERHSVEQMQKAQNANLAVGLGQVLLGRPSGAAAAGINVAGSAIFAGYSRDAEREADVTGVRLVTRAGINPLGMETFFEELLKEERRSPGVLQWFSTHPGTEERIELVRQAIRQTPGAQAPALTEDTREFQQFKARIRQLPPAPKQQGR